MCVGGGGALQGMCTCVANVIQEIVAIFVVLIVLKMSYYVIIVNSIHVNWSIELN